MAIDSVFSGGGEMGALMRAFDWSQTALGPVSNWTHSLKTAVRIVLTSRFAMFVWWGRELVNLYNDPYRAFLGIKHPAALGKSAREVWVEIWDQIGPRTDAVLLRGDSTYDEALLLLMARHGYPEETYFTFAYSPLPDDKGNVGGLFCAVTEATQRVIGERRLRLLREIAAAMAESRTSSQVCELAAQCLSNARRDLPFTLIYMLYADGKSLTKAAQTGFTGAHRAAPASAPVDDAGTDRGGGELHTGACRHCRRRAGQGRVVRLSVGSSPRFMAETRQRAGFCAYDSSVPSGSKLPYAVFLDNGVRSS